jgi:hypothetical protein
MRTGGVSAYGQAGVEHQHAGLGPRREVPADGRGGWERKGRRDDSIRTYATRAVGKIKKNEKKGNKKRGSVEAGVREPTHPCFGGTKSGYSVLISA